MTDAVWVSSVMSDHTITNKQGIREKFYGEDWAPPTFILDMPPERVIQAMRRHNRGETLERTDFPEAMYVFNEGRWKQGGELFSAGPFYAVKGKLAEVLGQFDLGTGGLIEFPIYEADKVTPLPGPFYFLNFGSVKDSFVPQESKSLRDVSRLTSERSEWWATYDIEDGDIAVRETALEGADLWFEKKLKDKIFMSGRLHDAIVAAKVKTKFRFAQARII
ncbi:hypothetical protein G6L41_017185 [Agrobacterium tumefaciens]|uniref:hypothetical protein n=1 Tax=Agrobacterium tumefaciens TaxID=358 RepID=UPI0015730188|nr:hypothetical protein [Agrobacterium tumefaciens]WCK15360.1 hypothetical protein G6L41_017185 [Agrobacterium tumefaciens]